MKTEFKHNYFENIPSPAWHCEVLQDREDALKNQTDSFVDWNKAKQAIRNRCHESQKPDNSDR